MYQGNSQDARLSPMEVEHMIQKQQAQYIADQASYGKAVMTAPAPVTLSGQISDAHALVDRLGSVVDGLEKRLSPILGPNHSEGCDASINTQSEPPVIEEMARLLMRLRSVCSYVDSIERRTRI